MKRIVTLMLLTMCMLLFVRATCGPTKPFKEGPVQRMKINDYVYFHNASITFDGRHYFTINGGNDGYCMVNEYDRNGNYIDSYDVMLDGRSIWYNSKEDQIYVKIYGTDIYVLDLEYEDAYLELEYLFEEDNSSIATSPDGKFLYEIVDGRITVYDFRDGEEVRSFKIDEYYDEHGYSSSIAASDDYLFVWGDTDVVIVYDLNGKQITKITLPRDGYGFSLSYTNDMLWIAKDADGSSSGDDGYWYGYELK